MTKEKYSHGIKVGSKVRVVSCEGSSAYRPFIGQVLTVDKVEPWVYPGQDHKHDLIYAGGLPNAQWPERFELVTERTSLPDVFTFTVANSTYRMTKKANGDYLCSGTAGNSAPWNAKEVLGNTNDGTWEFLEDITPKLPRKFKVKHRYSGNKYDVNLDNGTITAANGQYTGHVHYGYSESEVQGYVNNGVWLIEPEPTAKELAEQAVTKAKADLDTAIDNFVKALKALAAAEAK